MQNRRDPLELFLGAVARTIWRLLKNLFFGIRRLKTLTLVVVFMVCVLAAYLVSRNKESILGLQQISGLGIPLVIRYLLYGALLLIPLWYLLILGSRGNAKAIRYYSIFSEIGFIGKDNKYPYLLNIQKNGKQTNYKFKSNIPITEWEKYKPYLETGFDCNIRRIEQGRTKKIVELHTVPSEYRLEELICWNDNLLTADDANIVIGENELHTIDFDLNRTPHVLIAGETGSGKSVILRCILWQMIRKGSKIYMLDFKGGVEFGKRYDQYGEVIMKRERALQVLEELVLENEKRLALFREQEVKNLQECNDKTGLNLCRIGVFCDEIAEMLDKKGLSKDQKEIYEKIEAALSTLARLSRATGINLFLGVQRPDANILPGQIKNNIPVRISGHFSDKSASEIVLGNTQAYSLPDTKGRFIFRVGNQSYEFQAYYFDDEENLKEKDQLVLHEGRMLTEAVKEEKTVKKQSAKERLSEMEQNGDFKLDLDFEI